MTATQRITKNTARALVAGLVLTGSGALARDLPPGTHGTPGKTSTATARKAPARKAPARRAPARRAPARKAPAHKAPAARTPAKTPARPPSAGRPAHRSTNILVERDGVRIFLPLPSDPAALHALYRDVLRASIPHLPPKGSPAREPAKAAVKRAARATVKGVRKGAEAQSTARRRSAQAAYRVYREFQSTLVSGGDLDALKRFRAARGADPLAGKAKQAVDLFAKLNEKAKRAAEAEYQRVMKQGKAIAMREAKAAARRLAAEANPQVARGVAKAMLEALKGRRDSSLTEAERAVYWARARDAGEKARKDLETAQDAADEKFRADVERIYAEKLAKLEGRARAAQDETLTRLQVEADREALALLGEETEDPGDEEDEPVETPDPESVRPIEPQGTLLGNPMGGGSVQS